MIDYWKEFELNLKHQLKDVEIKEPMQVGYMPDEGIIVMTFMFPIDLFKKINEGEKK